MTVKLVADLTDAMTYQVCRKILNEARAGERERILDKKGFSHKYIDYDFNSLTPAIQSLIITEDAYVIGPDKSEM